MKGETIEIINRLAKENGKEVVQRGKYIVVKAKGSEVLLDSDFTTLKEIVSEIFNDKHQTQHER